ncbi:unnamed protein product [Brassica napus]|uniref:(rape) hypothetical protein n=1 Tax=Brassica napus TaxID=3708 RepID=A0A816P839_BRANA|nr:unnamed protein product [Brassica napus]
MIYTAIDNFYLTEEQLKTSPSRKDGIDEATEVAFRIYGCDCDVIQEGGILLNLESIDDHKQLIMATGQIVAASCVWLASKLEENPKRQDGSQGEKYSEVKVELSRTERHILNDGFCMPYPSLFLPPRDCDCKSMDEELTRYAATRIKEYMNNNRSKDEIVRILYQQHAIPVYLTLQAWDQTEIESSGIFQEYFVQSLLNPDAETTDQGPTQIAPTSMGTAGRDTGASSSFLRVPPPTGDALIPVQQAVSSGTAQNVPIVTSAQVPPLTGDSLSPVVQLPFLPQAVMATGQVFSTGSSARSLFPNLMLSFVCHVEHPHKFISNYLATLETPPELRQEAWNLANDSLRTTLCVRFRSEVVACGVVYAAARRFQVPLPENPPWWKAFDADKSGIDQVCSVLAHLYSLPKAQYISVCKDGKTFTFSSRSGNPQAQSATKDVLPAGGDAGDTKGSAVNEFKDEVITTPHEKATNSKKREAESNSLPIVGDSREKKNNRFDFLYQATIFGVDFIVLFLWLFVVSHGSITVKTSTGVFFIVYGENYSQNYSQAQDLYNEIYGPPIYEYQVEEGGNEDLVLNNIDEVGLHVVEQLEQTKDVPIIKADEPSTKGTAQNVREILVHYHHRKFLRNC